MSDLKISLIHPSRGRIREALEARDRWLSKAGMKVEYILSVDSDQALKYIEAFGSACVGKNRSAVDAINYAAGMSHGDILVQMAEDFDCPWDWALKIIEATKDKYDWILKTQDGIQKWMITLPIMDRAYYNRFGYIYHPDYLHMFCDLEASCVADLTGRRITSDLEFPHNHYSTGRSPKDATSIKADATWEQGKKLFLERYARGFDISNPIGQITDMNTLNWVRQMQNA